MNTKAAMLLVALMALMASSQAISSNEKQKITKQTAPLTIPTESVFVDVGNRKMAMMVLRAPAENCITEGNPCGPSYWCCYGLFCDILSGFKCHRSIGGATSEIVLPNRRSGLPTPLSSIV
ncbi:hypothetical protein LIER_43859 [Lithospermum erythrorhizon]|uniref:Uncharacterized protein n=1 Tax=Lithospermum erythrorhizon TaxID=34254 RepID=A0AAV3R016_LITER